jgi:hypothetical protein
MLPASSQTRHQRKEFISVSGYRPGPRFGVFGFLVGLLILGAVAVVAYNLGASAGAVSTGTGAAAPVVYGPWLGFGFGFFPFFGFLFFILILFLLLRAIFRPWGWGHGWRGGYWGGYGPGGSGYKGTETRDVPPPFEPMLESWHKRAHGETPPAGDATRPTDRPS